MTATNTQTTEPATSLSGHVCVEDGLYEGVHDPDYRRWATVDGVTRMSKSTLEHANPGDAQQDMFRLKLSYEGKLFKDSDALAFGRAFDCRLLTPELYRQQYAVLPEDLPRKNSKAYVEVMDAWDASNPGREGVKADDAALIDAMAKAIYAHKVVRLIREKGGAQTSLAWEDENTGVPMRARFDKRVLFKGGWWIIDVKTVRDCSDLTVIRQITDYGYHRQAAIYSDGHLAVTGKLPVFLFVFVSKDTVAPTVRTEVLDPAYIQLGRAEYRHTLMQWDAAVKSGVYPRPYPDIHELEAPKWVEGRIETFGGLE